MGGGTAIYWHLDLKVSTGRFVECSPMLEQSATRNGCKIVVDINNIGSVLLGDTERKERWIKGYTFKNDSWF